ncbi:Kazal-type serine protease inhibitor domain [Phytophthora infestans]|uniref:Kazal-type serine protease inhibitor domain n=1 Tax=Phytophthora infestans TaxID=4787 RepID=A0A833SH93_PHYIN|nr:Kazal-type serine protease inhibitor domain [Phytophthora infestans]
MRFAVGLILAAVAVTTTHAGNHFMMNDSSIASASGSDDISTSCNFACFHVMRPVKDENGVMYPNECEMRRARCRKNEQNVDVQGEQERI